MENKYTPDKFGIYVIFFCISMSSCKLQWSISFLILIIHLSPSHEIENIVFLTMREELNSFENKSHQDILIMILFPFLIFVGWGPEVKTRGD